MSRRQRDPRDRAVAEGVLEHIRRMSQDDWLREVAWRPEGVEETWRLKDRDSRPPADGLGANGTGAGEPGQEPAALAAKSAPD
jgi:hypothetical protein